MTTSQLEIVQFDLAVLGFALWRPWITILALVAVLLARGDSAVLTPTEWTNKITGSGTTVRGRSFLERFRILS